jgi:cell division protein FtsX
VGSAARYCEALSKKEAIIPLIYWRNIMPAKSKIVDNTMPDKIVIKPKAKKLIEELSTELNIKPEAVLIRALELLSEVNYNRKMFFDVGDIKENN